MSILTSVIDGKSSLAKIGSKIKKHNQKSVTKQAVHQRFKRPSVDFMEAVTAAVLTEKYTCDFALDSKLFNRVLIEDASLIQMHASNSKNFRGHGNKKGATAAYKIDFCYDLLSGKPITSTKVEAYANDKKAGSKLINSHIQKGDLCLRDMGYFKIANFLEIESKGAYWLSKIPTNVTITYKGKDLNEVLKNTKINKLDIEVMLGSGKKKCRLIAIRATPEQAAEKRRKANLQASNHGKKPRRGASLRNGWHILVTNISKEEMSSSKLIQLYRVRWQIETNFKAWKQSCELDACFKKKSNKYHLQCLIQASFILLLLTMKVVVLIQSVSKKWISIRKVAIELTDHLVQLRDIKHLTHFEPDIRSLTMETRNRENLMEIAKLCLT